MAPPAAAPAAGLKLGQKREVEAPTAAADAAQAEAPKRSNRTLIIAAAAVVVLGAAGFVGWKQFFQTPPPPPAKPAPTAKKVAPATAPSANTAAATPVSAPASAPAASATGPSVVASAAASGSDALNKLAHAPANAINKAQDAIAARRASGQSRIDAASVGEDAPQKPISSTADKSGARAPAASPAASGATSSYAGGAATAVDAAPEASAAFRKFVTTAKISGIFHGTPARAVINGRLARSGDVIDEGLGIIFEGVDNEHHRLVFKDSTGAVVQRKI